METKLPLVQCNLYSPNGPFVWENERTQTLRNKRFSWLKDY